MKRIVFLILFLCSTSAMAFWSISFTPGLNLWDNATGWGGLLGLQYSNRPNGGGLFFQTAMGYFTTGKDELVFQNAVLGVGLGYRLFFKADSPLSLAGALLLGVGANRRDDGVDTEDWKASLTTQMTLMLEYRISDRIDISLGLMPLSVKNSTYGSLSLATGLGMRVKLGDRPDLITQSKKDTLVDEIRKNITLRDRVRVEGKKIRIDLPEISFANNSDIVKPPMALALADIGKKIEKMQIRQILIEGHTDNVGDEMNNWRLSTQRAASVGAILINAGIHSEKISMKGYGSKKPRYPNSTPDGRNKNRRVEITIQQ